MPTPMPIMAASCGPNVGTTTPWLSSEMTANPMPGDQSRWGRFDLLQENNRTILQNLVESASTPRPNRTALEQKIGDYYASCMDEAAIEKLGAKPLLPELERIAHLKSKQDLGEYVATTQFPRPTEPFSISPRRTAAMSSP